jgi:integrase/recombinase XerD
MAARLTKTIRLDVLEHRGKTCLALYFDRDTELNTLVRTIPGRLFSKTHSCWYVEKTADAITTILRVFRGKAWVDMTALKRAETLPPDERVTIEPEPILPAQHTRPASHDHALQAMEKKLTLRGYSANTKRTYLNQFSDYLKFYYDSDPADLNELDIQRYMLYLIGQRKLGISTQNTAINAIKFFYEKILKQEPKVYALERPMREKKLPRVVSKAEIMALINAVDNLKHRLMLMLLYSAGLRRSELLNLRKTDLDEARGTVLIRGGKGRKDRQSLLASNVIPFFQQYLQEYKPVYWVFEGEGGGKYSASSLQKVLKAAIARTGKDSSITLHTLRHSFATHLLEAGVSTRYIQYLLGHESPKTTEIYTQVTRFALDKIRSPFDDMDINPLQLEDTE